MVQIRIPINLRENRNYFTSPQWGEEGARRGTRWEGEGASVSYYSVLLRYGDSRYGDRHSIRAVIAEVLSCQKLPFAPICASRVPCLIL